ncbi:hypothetical protein SAMN05444359_10564 [Neolewinella agarilytica]|uniref:Uncharacterized protein n=2 Tax=Neolewinella agarilytica TaxID=478744 RepID=A0A1H9CY84_9BACT|nr:hypothetical protein SAMN05444359_10564 [Neolewinella agarilytica]
MHYQVFFYQEYDTMYDLNDAYKQHLEAIAEAIQASPNLATFLEEEEDEFYDALKLEFEPQIEQAHQQLIDYSPLEIEAFERYLLDERFEGLFLPRALGYAVLRGEVTEHYYYARQNDHFGTILKAIAVNSNFDQLSSRIGQSVQCGFALSSDIFVTGLVDGVPSKRVRQFLQAQRSSDARTMEGRRRIERRYRKQFRNRNYHYAPFPVTTSELTTYNSALIDFLLFRVSGDLPNDALMPTLHAMVTRPEFAGRKEILRPMAIYGAYFTPSEEGLPEFMEAINRERKADPEGMANAILSFILELKQNREVPFGPEQEQRLGNVIDRTIDDDLSAYFNLTDKIHGDGYVNPDVHEAIMEEQGKHPGLSPFNENIRETIHGYFSQLAKGLGTNERDYMEWFEITGKQFPAYIKIFGNESFNQQLRALARKYTKDLIKVHTNKRGKDYRDIKKTTMATWQDYGFMTEKQLKEFFKTPRKKKIEE